MIPDIKNSAETDVAPLIHNFVGNGETFKQLIDIQEADEDVNNHFNYILKCTDGLFKDKFLYINTTPDGESFGSGDPDEYDLTMYIESDCLSKRHAEIRFDYPKYLLRDCGSENGTWVRIGHPCQDAAKGYTVGDLDLHNETRLRTYKAGQHVFQIEETGQDFDQVAAWLTAN